MRPTLLLTALLCSGNALVAASDPLQCALSRPHGVFVDRDGVVFIGDTKTHRVRVVR